MTIPLETWYAIGFEVKSSGENGQVDFFICGNKTVQDAYMLPEMWTPEFDP